MMFPKPNSNSTLIGQQRNKLFCSVMELNASEPNLTSLFMIEKKTSMTTSVIVKFNKNEQVRQTNMNKYSHTVTTHLDIQYYSDVLN